MACHFVDSSSTHSYETALALSVFFGMLGLDRFYLGYPAIGLLKLATFGFLLIGQVSRMVVPLLPPGIAPAPVSAWPLLVDVDAAGGHYPDRAAGGDPC